MDVLGVGLTLVLVPPPHVPAPSEVEDSSHASGDSPSSSSRVRERECFDLPWPRSTSTFLVRGSRFAVRPSRVSRSCFAVRRSPSIMSRVSGSVRRQLCLAFHVRASRFAVRRQLCLAFHVRFAVRGSRFAVRSSWFAVRGSQV